MGKMSEEEWEVQASSDRVSHKDDMEHRDMARTSYSDRW